ncbi:MAG: ribonuclease P protein component [Candidatus Taylorbacteria bacterium RIFCSPHIGHO2_02_FULL_47_18]|uniref:Ribonuclease P protein component n=1 Tax=Candidatus Taylorbacteria bacterium RIFCSPLOWO2_01_FULL_48_100 TaxID=1802322 RepID=A0A1G2NCP7_9BACT|nr:MAG: ribonuclease P protein component [Candidatus Taylorbacteria bacterium RIFCSPHIGHO2_02_FULL_47_18]OHA33885.1 MAG: ribonuclease P protein component [Candidatus Taylorbacteria bacterium RIFCSPLOWO2_01_FULL_48_100]OHA40860.1 MAG: ribonuclease P protein component [Candidatus Taylorbacteria bacterium RIFCSPLOWO2_02_FULL_48_16]OHA45128.1 MAG: ribonuclease P protein component [Candidatus Taylorbacteria bacterium RIFCSPLOWO2_12_FULL_48_11]
MLKKVNRITTEGFRKLSRSNCMLHTDFFSVRLHQTTHKQPRFAVVASKKIAPTAVMRNLLRRRLYELFGKKIGNISGGTAVVVFVKKEANKASFQELKGAVENLDGF